jgi:ATP-dependent RNA helicase SUPV3L1/SUV3
MGVEDDLSDALHKALVSRFALRGKRWVKLEAQPPSGPFAALRDLLVPAAAPERSLLERIASAEHAELSVDGAGTISFGGEIVAKMVRGRDLRSPEVKLALPASPSERLRAERRLVAFVRDLVREVSDDVLPNEALLSAAAKGLRYVLSLGLTTASALDVADQVSLLSPDDARLFREAGFVLGRLAVYHPKMLKPNAVRLRTAFVATFEPSLGQAPSGKEISTRTRPSVGRASYTALGYPVIGGRAVRADILERVAKRLTDAPRDEWPNLPLGAWLGVPEREAHPLLEELAPNVVD